MGSDPTTAPRSYYVYNGHGDVVALVDASGASVASYCYDAFGQLTVASENFGGTTTWTNPYRYDGRDGVRYDGETGLSWMSVRAYDPALGRFLSRDPLGRVPLFFADQPYVYGGNNPLVNVDPSGQRFLGDMGRVRATRAVSSPTRMNTAGGKKSRKGVKGEGSLSESVLAAAREQTYRGEGAPNDAAWGSEDPSQRYTIWLGKIDKPDAGTDSYHVNLHIRSYRSPVDVFNVHISYGGFDGMNDTWVWRNHVPKVSEHEKEHEIMKFALGMPNAWAVDEVMKELLGTIQERSGVPILT